MRGLPADVGEASASRCGYLRAVHVLEIAAIAVDEPRSMDPHRIAAGCDVAGVIGNDGYPRTRSAAVTCRRG